MRRDLDALPDRNGQLREPEYDVILEIWYPDEATFSACRAALSESSAAREIAEDEAQLFDLDHMRSYLVEECESEMS